MYFLITKNKKTLLFFSIVLSVLCSCSKDGEVDPTPSSVDTLSTGWKKITIQGISFGDIFFINNNIGFAVGGSDAYKSSDGGNSWQKVYHTPGGLVNIAMGNELNIIFTTSTNKVIFTKDGGITFDSVLVGNNAVFDAFFVNTNTVFAVGKSFWKSVNAGSTWTKLYDFSSNEYQSLYFLSDQNGWIAGAGGVYKTINGGVTWEQKTIGPEFNFSSSGSVFFPDVNTGYVSDGSHVGKTTNIGSSWTKVFTGGAAYQDLHFVSAATGYLTNGSYIYKTSDGGSTWNKEVVLPGKQIIELHFTDASHGWACGSDGIILKYQN